MVEPAGDARARARAPEVPRRERLACRPSLEALLPQAIGADRALRNERIRHVLRSGDFSAAEIGRHLGLHYSTISRIAADPSAGACAASATD